jgi:hypothetical protein
MYPFHICIDGNMRKSDLLGVLALLTGGLFVLPGESAVAALLVAIAAYLFSRSTTRPTRRLVAAKLGALRGLGARGR